MFSKNNDCPPKRQVKSAKIARLPKPADLFPLAATGRTDPVAGVP
jgi:hypothetical protein